MTTEIDLADRLTRWLEQKLPAHAADLRIQDLDTFEAGHSAHMMTFTLVTGSGDRQHHRKLVLRLRPPPPALLEPYDLFREFTVLRALEPTAVKAPRPLWAEPATDILGREFFVMDYVAGDVYEMSQPEGRDATAVRVRRMCAGMAEQLAAVHRVDLAATGLDALGDGRNFLTAELQRWFDEMRRVRRGPLPALQRLCEELLTNLPGQCPTSTLVHGDAKPGNFAFVNGDVSALFDWELVAVGDPLTDIGWMEVVWMQPVGIPSHPSALTIDQFIEHYESASGITVRHRPWYRALAAFKMAVICLIGSRLFHEGFSDDRRLVLNASAIPYFTQIGLAELGVGETLEAGPVMPANE